MTQHPVFWTFLFLIVHWYLSLAPQSIFHHRIAAHEMVDLKKWQIKFLYILSSVCMGSSYLSARAYGSLHRLHHKYADTEDDPHSPLFSQTLLAMMIRTKNEYVSILKGTFVFREKDLWMKENLPTWDWFDWFASSWGVRLFWAGIYVSIYLFIGTPWFLYPLLVIHFLTGPLHGAIVNWCAHKYGENPHKTGDTSRNLPWYIWILVLDEAYHNNHHADQNNPKFGPVAIYYWMATGILRLKFKKNHKKSLTA